MAKTPKTEAAKIGWDHPIVAKYGIAPGYLMQELFGYSDSYWKAQTPQWAFCKIFNGEPWFSIRAFEEYLAAPGASRTKGAKQ